MLGVIYYIRNIHNGRVYVGMTQDYKYRKKKHESNLRCGDHHSHILQHDYDKYGKEAFDWGILEENIPIEDIEDAEYQWIEQLEAYSKGYNLTKGGDFSMYGEDNPAAIACVWEGVSYPTIKAAAKAAGVNYSTMAARISRGYTCSADITQNTHAKSCTWEGVEYPSVNQAAKALGISKAAMQKRLRVRDSKKAQE